MTVCEDFAVGQTIHVVDRIDTKKKICKVVDIDNDQQKIKIHYVKWNSSYDEWLEMSSSRIVSEDDVTDCVDTEMKVALSELSGIDPTVDKIMNHYVPSRSDAQNEQCLYNNFPVSTINLCADSLAIATDDDYGKKLKKRTVINLILCKIKSMLPLNCSQCNEIYKLKIDDEPLFTCYQCKIASHDCNAFKTLKDSIPNLLQRGFVWLCGSCHRDPTQANEHSKDESSVDQNQKTTTETVNTDELENLPIPRKVQYESRNSDRPICNKYKKGTCRHGLKGTKIVDGKPCSFDHPKRCFQYCKFGLGGKLGCRWGRECRYFHPVLCKSSVNSRKCLVETCTYVHLKGTKRNESSPDYHQPHSSQVPTKDNMSATTKNDQLERIEQMILSMKKDYDQELNSLRSGLMYVKGGGYPWLGIQSPPMQSPHVCQSSNPNCQMMSNVPHSSPSQLQQQTTMAPAKSGSMPHCYY